MRLEYDKLTKHLTDTETSLKDALDLVKSKVSLDIHVQCTTYM